MGEISKYELRHLARHLFHAEKYDDLLLIARHRAFSEAQAQAFPEMPDLPLNTVRFAAATIAHLNRAEPSFELSLRQLQLALAIDSETPVKAAAGGMVARAWKLADSVEPEKRSVWYALLALLFAVTGAESSLSRTIERFATSEVPAVEVMPGRFLDQENSWNTLLLYVLRQLVKTHPSDAKLIAQKTLPEWQSEEVLSGKEAAEYGRSESSLHERAEKAAWKKARSQLRKRNTIGAASSLRRISFDGYGNRIGAFISLAHPLLKGSAASDGCLLLGEALIVEAHRQRYESQRLVALCDLSESLYHQGKPDLSAGYLRSSVEQASQLVTVPLKFNVCQAAALAVAEIRGVPEALVCVRDIMGDAEPATAYIAPYLVGKIARKRQVQLARQIICAIKEPGWIDSYANIARAQVTEILAQDADFTTAYEVLDEIEIRTFESDAEMQSWSEYAKAFEPIARALAEKGELAEVVEGVRKRLRPPAINTFGAGIGYVDAIAAIGESIMLNAKGTSDIVAVNRFFQVANTSFIKSTVDMKTAAELLITGHSRGVSTAVPSLDRIGDPYWRALVLIKLASIATKSGSLSLLEQARTYADQEPQFLGRVRLLKEIGSCLVAQGADRSFLRLVARSLRESLTCLASNLELATVHILEAALSFADLDVAGEIVADAGRYPTSAYRFLTLLGSSRSEHTEFVIQLIDKHTWKSD